MDEGNFGKTIEDTVKEIQKTLMTVVTLVVLALMTAFSFLGRGSLFGAVLVVALCYGLSITVGDVVGYTDKFVFLYKGYKNTYKGLNSNLMYIHLRSFTDIRAKNVMLTLFGAGNSAWNVLDTLEESSSIYLISLIGFVVFSIWFIYEYVLFSKSVYHLLEFPIISTIFGSLWLDDDLTDAGEDTNYEFSANPYKLGEDREVSADAFYGVSLINFQIWLEGKYTGDIKGEFYRILSEEEKLYYEEFYQNYKASLVEEGDIIIYPKGVE